MGKKMILECKICNKEFYVKPSRIKKGGGKYCSYKCRNIGYKLSFLGDNNPSWKGGKIIKTCDQCGKKYEVSKHRNELSRFCSRKCKDKSLIGKKRRVDIIKECLICGKEFKTHNCWIKRHNNTGGRYCSLKCASIRNAQLHFGENHPHWNGGTSFKPYTYDFNHKMKEKIRKRDNFCCRICGKSEKELGYTLHIHHIDYNKLNSIDSNLISLCRVCHGKTQFDRTQYKFQLLDMVKNSLYNLVVEDNKCLEKLD